LTDQNTCPSEMQENTTSQCKCQKYRGGTLARRHVEVAAIASGGRPCRHRGIMQSIFCTNIVSTGADSEKIVPRAWKLEESAYESTRAVRQRW
jgi:hypothetical protein